LLFLLLFLYSFFPVTLLRCKEAAFRPFSVLPLLTLSPFFMNFFFLPYFQAGRAFSFSPYCLPPFFLTGFFFFQFFFMPFLDHVHFFGGFLSRRLFSLFAWSVTFRMPAHSLRTSFLSIPHNLSLFPLVSLIPSVSLFAGALL